MCDVEESVKFRFEPHCTEMEKLDGVEITDSVLGLGGQHLIASRSFKPGELVLKERALAVSEASTNHSRVLAYCNLQVDDRERFLQIFSGGDSCLATAPCETEDDCSLDSAGEIFASMQRESTNHQPTQEEVQKVIKIWNLNAYGNAVSPLICKIDHSCGPNVYIHVEAGKLTATAVRSIEKGAALGSWYLQDTGFFWMGHQLRNKQLLELRGFACGCERCANYDVCRGLLCPKCGKGTVYCKGSSWRCGGDSAGCGYESSGSELPLGIEAELSQQVLAALRPERGSKPKDLAEVIQLRDEVREYLGTQHWAFAAMDVVASYRRRAATGGVLSSAEAAFEGLRFVDWLSSRNLPLAPARVIRTPISLAVDVAHYYGLGAAAQSTDGRCISSRLIRSFILPVLAGSCGDPALAGLQSFWQKVAAVSALSEKMKEDCGACGFQLGNGTDSKKGMLCGRCKQIAYCSKECQARDWRQRHKNGCLPATESLSSEKCQRLLCGST